jgi:protein O-GlcNAc transferase
MIHSAIERTVGRNAACPCGSRKKYKHCCGSAAHRAPAGSGAQEWYEQGNRQLSAGNFAEAIEHYRHALTVQPGLYQAHSNLGVALEEKGSLAEALTSYWAAVVHSAGTPDGVAAYTNYLGCVGRYQRYLFDLQRSGTHSPDFVFGQHLRFGKLLESQTASSGRPHLNEADPERRLRVGYLSPDFRRHSVAYFIEPVLAHHDRRAVEVFCYYSCPLRDQVTDRIAATADHWLVCTEMSHDSLAARIRDDGIDVLVDLAGHTIGNRAQTFVLKPAPIQIAYLGYPATTGLTTMDYRLTDALADPDGASDALFVEKPLRLSPAMTVYRRPSGNGGLLGSAGVEVTPAPALRNGYATFGCFNDVSKVSDSVVETWARLLAAVPNSRLLLKSRGLEDTARHAGLLVRFAKRGVDTARIKILGRIEEPESHLRLYGEVDVALDTFPYNGVTTSFEAMWMGVPFVTLAGTPLASRMGVSIATNVGHPEWIARTPDEYVAKACSLASELQGLNTLRLNLRQELEESPLMDARRFTGSLEAAYRDVWRRWCAQRKPSS